jgi:hypothetical protein
MSTTADVFAGATNDSNPSAKFAQIGDTYQGTIIRVGEFSGPNKLKNNQAETSVSIDLELAAPVSGTAHDGQPFAFNPGDTVVLWARTHIEDKVAPNGLTRAIADAVRQGTGLAGLPQVGGQLAVRFDSVGTPSQQGLNPPKYYVAQYKPPAAMPVQQAGGPFDQPAQQAPAPTAPQPPAPAQPAPPAAQQGPAAPADNGVDLFA